MKNGTSSAGRLSTVASEHVCSMPGAASRCNFYKWACARGLPLPISEKMASSWRVNRYRKGDILFYQGNEPLSLYFLCSGAVKLVRADGTGRQYILRVIDHADFLGDRALLAGQTYAASCQVLKDSQICAFDATRFLDFWRVEPDLARMFARYLALKLAAADTAASDLALHTIRELLAKLIVRRIEETGNGSFEFSESRQDLAELLGTSPEVISRTLSELERKGLLTIDGRNLKILNETRLRAAARVPRAAKRPTARCGSISRPTWRPCCSRSLRDDGGR